MAAQGRLRATMLRRVGGLSFIVLLLPMLAIACSTGNNNKKAAGTSPTAFSQPATVASTSAANATGTSTTAAAVSPTVPPDNSPIAHFLMPKFGIDANMVVLGIDPATNTMQAPNNKDDVGYYNFTSLPGTNCTGANQCPNTVLAGHVDWYTGQWGVFEHLRDLKAGDTVELKLTDGTLYKYKVVSNTLYPNNSAPVAQIIGKTAQPSVTLITCDGVFNKASQEYNMRRVVRAVRESA